MVSLSNHEPSWWLVLRPFGKLRAQDGVYRSLTGRSRFVRFVLTTRGKQP